MRLTLQSFALPFVFVAELLFTVDLLAAESARKTETTAAPQTEAVQICMLQVAEKSPMEGKTIGELTALADHASPQIRCQAVEALGNYRSQALKALPVLIRLLGDSDTEVKKAAARVIGDLGRRAKSAVPAVTRGLNDPDWTVRFAMAQAHWRLARDPQPVLPVFIETLSNERADTESRYEAAEGLYSMGPLAASAVDTLIRALQHNDDRALDRLDSSAAPAVDTLSRALQYDDYNIRHIAAKALGNIGPNAKPAIPALLALVKDARHDQDDLARYAAGDALGLIGDATVIPDLIALLGQGDDFGAYCAADALRQFGPQAKAAISALLAAHEGEQLEGITLARTLGSIDSTGTTIPVLVQLLTDPDPSVRKDAADALSQIGHNSQIAEQGLREQLNTSSPDVRAQVAVALWKVSGKAQDSTAVLNEMLADPNPDVCAPALLAIRSMGSAAADTLPGLRRLIKSDQETLRQSAMLALGSVGPQAKGAVPQLMEVLQEDDLVAAMMAVEALGRIGPDAVAAVPLLEMELHSTRGLPRYFVVVALWRITHSPQSLPTLMDAAENCYGRFALLRIAEVLGEMGPHAKKAIPSLQWMLKDHDADVRKAAAQAIARIEEAASPPGGTLPQ